MDRTIRYNRNVYKKTLLALVLLGSAIMYTLVTLGLIAFIGIATGLPTDPIIKLDPEIRYGLMADADGKIHIVDLWLSADDLVEAARYTPITENIYHLFTRDNPTLSQPLLFNNEYLLSSSNYNPKLRTIVIVHGWTGDATHNLNRVLVPAFLAAENVNVIVVDWNAGAGTLNYAVAVVNTVTSGVAVAGFINWLNQQTNASPSNFHIVGHSLGGHQSGIIARYIDGDVPYVTSLDPAMPGWITNEHKFRHDDALYTEVIHTNGGVLGYLSNLGDVDFYPNGGRNMAGCDDYSCSHDRCYYYFAESLTSGGFTGHKCNSFVAAITGSCSGPETLQLGGLTPKTGESGVYHMETNPAPPFSQG